MALLISIQKISNVKNTLDWTVEWFINVFPIHLQLRLETSSFAYQVDGRSTANAAAHRFTSKCINTHHCNSSNPTTKKSNTIRLAIFSSDLRGVLEMEKEKRYFLLSVTNDIFCVLSRMEKVRKYIARFCAREKENILTKNYHFLLFDWFYPWWIAWREIKSRKSLKM